MITSAVRTQQFVIARWKEVGSKRLPPTDVQYLEASFYIIDRGRRELRRIVTQSSGTPRPWRSDFSIRDAVVDEWRRLA